MISQNPFPSMLRRALLTVLFLILIGLSVIGCGGNDSVAVNPIRPNSSQEDDPSTDPATTLAVNLGLPGFVPNRIELIPPQQVYSTTIPILSSSYAIAWSGDFSEGLTVAQSRSGKPVTLDACTITAPGSHTLTATVYHPLDFGLFVPLANKTLPIEIDPGCAYLILDATLPEVTNENVPMGLEIHAQLIDQENNPIVDENGEQPPVSILLSPKKGSVQDSTGETDKDGLFSTVATLTQNLETVDIDILGRYLDIEESIMVSSVDPCNIDDPLEKAECLPPSPSPTPEPDDTPTPDPSYSSSPGPTQPPNPDPTPYPAPSPYVCQDCGSSYSYGDVHLVSFDKVAYDYHGAGEFHLAISDDPGFQVQVRQQPWRDRQYASINTAVAVRVGDERLAYYLNDPNGQSGSWWLNGQPTGFEEGVLPLSNGGSLSANAHRSRILWPTGEILFIRNSEGIALSLSTILNPNQVGVRGLAGYSDDNPDNDFTLASGEVLQQPLSSDQLYQFGDSWRIQPSESLFDYAPGQDSSSFTDLSFPYTDPPAVIDLPPAERQPAEATCLAAGITDPVFLKACIFDTVETQEPSFATAIEETEETIAEPVQELTVTFDRTLASPDPSAQERLGGSVSLSTDRMLVAAYNYDRITGRAYVYSVHTGSLLQTLLNPSPSRDDYFGGSTAVVGSRAAIGALGEDDAGPEAGAAYLFDINTGALLQTLASPNPTFSGFFGYSVAMTEDQILVGAPKDQIAGVNSGAAYLFDTHSGQLLHTYVNPSPESNDLFGSAVALSEDRVLVGASGDDGAGPDSGAAYLFDRVTGDLIQAIPNPATGSSKNFGQSVSLSPDLAAVGSGQGSEVYLFDAYSGAQLRVIGGPEGEKFGWSVSLHGDRLLVGAPESHVGYKMKGSATLYDANTGSVLEHFENPSIGQGLNFGTSVSLSDHQLLIGAPNNDNQAGAVYLFPAP